MEFTSISDDIWKELMESDQRSRDTHDQDFAPQDLTKGDSDPRGETSRRRWTCAEIWLSTSS